MNFCAGQPDDRQTFNRWYALGVGLCMYVGWNLFTCLGIVVGQSIPGLDQLGLEFSTAATFIALITPVVMVPSKRRVRGGLTVCGGAVQLLAMSQDCFGGAMAGMAAGYVCKRLGVYFS